MLDYCKTVNFNRNSRRLEHAAGLYDPGSSSTVNMPDEIDGDDRLGATQRSKFTNKLASIAEEEAFNLD